MKNNYSNRMAINIKKNLTSIIISKINDYRIKSISITDVHVSKDLALAKIYFSYFQSKYELIDIQKSLMNAKGFMRKQLALILQSKYTPKIEFYYDDTYNKNEKILKLINNIKYR